MVTKKKQRKPVPLRCDYAPDCVDRKTFNPCNQAKCVPCFQRNYRRKQRANDPEVQEYGRQSAAEWYRKPGNKERRRASDLKADYDLTPEEVDRLIEAQGGCCEFCHEPFGVEHAKTPVVDHDERIGRGVRGAVRGILHQECNRQLGYIEAWRDRIHRALEYADKAKDALQVGTTAVDQILSRKQSA